MKKYFETNTGEEIKFGDILNISIGSTDGEVTLDIVFNATSAQWLIGFGAIEERDVNVKADNNLDIPKVIIHLADRIGWNINNLDKYLDNLYKISPAAVFSVLLREVAIMLDERYPDHINKSKEVWIISTLDGEIKQIKELHKIKNFRNFAAFRSLDDALVAKTIMKDALRDLYGRK